MKSITLTTLFCLTLSLGAHQLPSQLNNWRLIWSDEFDGNYIDQAKWQHDIGGDGWGNSELEYYTDRAQNSFLENGNLVIQALKEDYQGNHYTSARITTSGKFALKYGKIEARAKLPQGQGLWPAFWLLGDDLAQIGWPKAGSIDVMEFIGRDPQNIYSKLQGPNFNANKTFHVEQGFHEAFHVFGVEWQPAQLDFSVDGQVFMTVKASDDKDFWPFDDHEFFIILDLAVGGSWPGSPDGSTQFPARYEVDYVRVYKQDQGFQHGKESFLQ